MALKRFKTCPIDALPGSLVLGSKYLIMYTMIAIINNKSTTDTIKIANNIAIAIEGSIIASTKMVGCIVGSNVGSNVGVSDGILVGYFVGSVGESFGYFVGSMVAHFVGASDSITGQLNCFKHLMLHCPEHTREPM